MKLSNIDRRQYVRYPLRERLLCFDHQSLIGVSHVADISEAGVCCVSLSEVTCPLTWVDSIELYDCKNDITVQGLKGKMVHALAVPVCGLTEQARSHYVFGLTLQCTPETREALLDYITKIYS